MGRLAAMRVKDLAHLQGFEAVLLPDPEREIEGVYIGDLLSWVMGRASSGNLWITIMSNVNVLAVATLTDVSCVLLAEGVGLDGELVKVAEQKEINVIKTNLPIYEAALAVRGMTNG